LDNRLFDYPAALYCKFATPFTFRKKYRRWGKVSTECGVCLYNLPVHEKGKGYEVEFTTLDGETIAIITLTAKQVRPSKPKEIAHVRDLAANP
jgi:hypothetical protein